MAEIDQLHPETKKDMFRDTLLRALSARATTEELARRAAEGPVGYGETSEILHSADDPFDAVGSFSRRAETAASYIRSPDWEDLKDAGVVDESSDEALYEAVADDPEFLANEGRGILSPFADDPDTLAGLAESAGIPGETAAALVPVGRYVDALTKRTRSRYRNGAFETWSGIPMGNRVSLIKNALALTDYLGTARRMEGARVERLDREGAVYRGMAAETFGDSDADLRRAVSDLYL